MVYLDSIVTAALTLLVRVMADSHSYSSVDHPLRHVDARNQGLRYVGNRDKPDHFKLLELDGGHLLIGASQLTGLHQKAISRNARCMESRWKRATTTNGTYIYTNEFSGQGISPYDPAHNSTALYLSERREIYAGTVADFTGVEPLVHRRHLDRLDDLGIRTERSDTKCLNDPNFVGSLDDEEHVYFWFREDAVEYMNCGKAVYSRVARICKKDQGSRRDPTTWTTFLKARLNCSLPGDYPFYFDEIEAISHVVQGKYGQHNADLVYAVFNTPFSAIRGSAVCAFSMNEVREIFAKSAFKSQPSPNANWQAVLKSKVPQPRPGSCEKDSMSMSDEAIAFAKANPLMNEAVSNFFSLPVMIYTGLRDRFTQIAVDPQIRATDGLFYDVIFIGTDHGRVLKVVNLSGKSKSDERSVLVETVKVFQEESPVRNLLVYRVEEGSISSAHLVVVSDHEVRRLQLHNCHRAKSCSACLRLRDPYCAWSQRKCVGKNQGWANKKMLQSIRSGFSDKCPIDLLEPVEDAAVTEEETGIIIESTIRTDKKPKNTQDQNYGNSGAVQHGTETSSMTTPCDCDESGSKKEPVTENMIPKVLDSNNAMTNSQTAHGRSTSIEQNPTLGTAYTAESLAIGILLSIIVALTVGFIAGYQCKKRECLRRKETDARKSPTVKHQNGPFDVGVKRKDSKSGHINAYEQTPKFNGVLPVPRDESPISMDMVLSLDSPLPQKKENSDCDTNTLPKEYKVKKVYL